MTNEPGEGRDLGVSLKLLWGDRTRPPRGRPATLSLDRIVAAAVEVADEIALSEGLEALSMRSIATQLGVGTMSLYRYVPGRSELLDLMLDHVIEIPEDEPDAEAGWRDVLTAEAHAEWRLCMDHPWYPYVDQSRPLLGPNSMRGLDRVFRLLRPSGIDDRTLMMMFGVQSDFVDGLARSYLNERRAEHRTGVSSDEFWQAQVPTLEKALGSGDFPTMADLADNTFDFSYEQLFEFGLSRLHDGFAAFIAARSG
ncbi:TetR/AcrR family transcriptional regulator [Actinomadura sp. 7K507]|uniref:TetR/AcrR family transcriptional regulator n=1 Tax=Actinomadura sp. 7K507 TaxID=2530365 RepID=UPI00105200FE|nr:TetR/AcrR family transcriptional regulator [Actinomadura sp. 7K507]TDC76911.1 TetR/AcrR family transcriptional regulator [Actinomadura sp. 7K507]